MGKSLFTLQMIYLIMNWFWSDIEKQIVHQKEKTLSTTLSPINA